MTVKTTTWTAFVKFPDGSFEEVDVTASSREEALLRVEEQLAAEYELGWIVKDIVAGNGLAFTRFAS